MGKSRIVRRHIAMVGCAITLALAGPGWASPRVRVDCSVDEGGGRCVFTNHGTDPGEACTTAQVTNEVTGHTTEADAVCSDVLAPGASITVPLVFSDEQPQALCVSAHPATTWASCATQSSIDESPPLKLWRPVLVLALLGSIAVFIDARRLGARRNLGPGLLAFPAITWAAGCLVGLFIPLVLYVRMRPKIKAAADYLPGGLMPPPYADPKATQPKRSRDDKPRSSPRY